MERGETLTAIGPLLRHRALRVLLVAAPGLVAVVATLTAGESNLAVAFVLNAAAGIIISSVLFLAVSITAHRVADERVGLARAAEEGFWRARVQLLSIHNEETGLYADWYFRLRLKEEIERSRRYGLHFGLLLVKPLGLHRDGEVEAASAWFGDRIRRHLRRSDLPALLHDGSLAVVMPSTSRRAAQTVRRRVTAELAPVEPRVGLACFPEGGEDPHALLMTATHAAMDQPRRGAA